MHRYRHQNNAPPRVLSIGCTAFAASRSNEPGGRAIDKPPMCRPPTAARAVLKIANAYEARPWRSSRAEWLLQEARA
jgi:hypothetical protein